MNNPNNQIEVVSITPFGPDEMVLCDGSVVKLPVYDPDKVLKALQEEEEMKPLVLTPVYQPSIDDHGSYLDVEGGWYFVVYDSENPTPEGVTSVYSTPLSTLRKDAEQDARQWCKNNHPNRGVEIGG